ALQAWPAVLSCDYSYDAIPLVYTWREASPALLATVAVLVAWIWAVWKRKQGVMLAAGIYLIGFTPMANIFLPTGTILGERLAYFPSVGFCLLIAVAWTFVAQKANRNIAMGVMAAMVAAM